MLSGRTGLVPYGTVTDPFIKVGWMVHWCVYTPVAVGIACAKVPVVCVLEAGIEAAAANVTLCRAMPPVHVHKPGGDPGEETSHVNNSGVGTKEETSHVHESGVDSGADAKEEASHGHEHGGDIEQEASHV